MQAELARLPEAAGGLGQAFLLGVVAERMAREGDGAGAGAVAEGAGGGGGEGSAQTRPRRRQELLRNQQLRKNVGACFLR